MDGGGSWGPTSRKRGVGLAPEPCLSGVEVIRCFCSQAAADQVPPTAVSHQQGNLSVPGVVCAGVCTRACTCAGRDTHVCCCERVSTGDAGRGHAQAYRGRRAPSEEISPERRPVSVIRVSCLGRDQLDTLSFVLSQRWPDKQRRMACWGRVRTRGEGSVSLSPPANTAAEKLLLLPVLSSRVTLPR